jgi:hypothetical protein
MTEFDYLQVMNGLGCVFATSPNQQRRFAMQWRSYLPLPCLPRRFGGDDHQYSAGQIRALYESGGTCLAAK